MSFECLQSQTTKDSLHDLSKARSKELSKLANSSKPPDALLQYRAAVKNGHCLDIPSPSIFAFSEETKSSTALLPSAAQCATHLELLQTFYVLRQRVLTSTDVDKSCNIAPKRRVVRVGRYGTKTLRDNTLWDRRQIKWTKYVEFAVVRFLIWKETMAIEHHDEKLAVELQRLPPVDVLMVWHAFMLNPRLFERHCENDALYRVKMPWKMIHSTIHNLEWDYVQEEMDDMQFEIDTGLPANLFETFKYWAPYSELAGIKSAEHLTSFSLKNIGESNAESNIKDHKPAPSDEALAKDGINFTTHRSGYTPAQQTAVSKQVHIASLYSRLFHKYDALEGNVASQLRDAVVRQCDFVDKMNTKLWIRSPALEGTLCRAINRYHKFLQLIRLHPNLMVVPTLDIDLVWHTHQCAAAYYGSEVWELTGKFVNHDDKLGKGTLSSGMEETRKLFRIHFGENYMHCGCWECEALLDHVEEAVKEALRTGEEAMDMAEIAKIVAEEVTLYREMELATRTRHNKDE